MSVHTTNQNASFSGFFDGLRAFAATIGKALVVNRSMDARLAQIEALQSKTDDELQALGLRRDQVAAYVFRDLFYA